MIEKTDWLILPEFSPHVFSDRDIAKIDFQRDATFVIDALTSAVSLRVNAVNLAAAIFQIPKTMFKCYTSKPNND